MRRLFTAVLAVAALSAWGAGARAANDDLETLLKQVGPDYARGYAAPLIHGFGPAQNGNLFSTAHVGTAALTFGVGIKAMGTYLAAGDQSFRKVKENVDLGDFDPAYAGTTGTVVMAGPTVFGDTNTDGTLDGYVNGIQVFHQSTIPGLVDSRWVPMIMPEAYVGGVMGLKAIVRYMPSVGTDVGDLKYWGFGGQWCANTVLPALPVDVMVGYMGQKLEVGSIVTAEATSLHLAVSKSLTTLTVYGGVAKETSSMDVSYVYEGTGTPITFSEDGRQKTRFTLGATLDILMKLNVEVGHGDLTTYSAGLMFGL